MPDVRTILSQPEVHRKCLSSSTLPSCIIHLLSQGDEAGDSEEEQESEYAPTGSDEEEESSQEEYSSETETSEEGSGKDLFFLMGRTAGITKQIREEGSGKDSFFLNG